MQALCSGVVWLSFWVRWLAPAVSNLLTQGTSLALTARWSDVSWDLSEDGMRDIYDLIRRGAVEGVNCRKYSIPRAFSKKDSRRTRQNILA